MQVLSSVASTCLITYKSVSKRNWIADPEAARYFQITYSAYTVDGALIQNLNMQASFQGRAAFLPSKVSEAPRGSRGRAVKVQAIAAPPALDTRQSERVSLSIPVMKLNFRVTT